MEPGKRGVGPGGCGRILGSGPPFPIGSPGSGTALRRLPSAPSTPPHGRPTGRTGDRRAREGWAQLPLGVPLSVSLCIYTGAARHMSFLRYSGSRVNRLRSDFTARASPSPRSLEGCHPSECFASAHIDAVGRIVACLLRFTVRVSDVPHSYGALSPAGVFVSRGPLR